MGFDPAQVVPGGGLRGGLRGLAAGGVSNLLGNQDKECWTRDRRDHSDRDDPPPPVPTPATANPLPPAYLNEEGKLPVQQVVNLPHGGYNNIKYKESGRISTSTNH